MKNLFKIIIISLAIMSYYNLIENFIIENFIINCKEIIKQNIDFIVVDLNNFMMVINIKYSFNTNFKNFIMGVN